MKALNLRLLAILLVGAVIFGGAVYGIHHYQVRRNAYVFKDIADKARQEAEDAEAKEDVETAREKYQEVAENLGWYVKLVPHDIDAEEEYGLLLADLTFDSFTRRRFSLAFATLEDILRKDPERIKSRRRLVDLAMMIRRYKDARSHLEGYLLKKNPKDPELLDLLGRCQVAVREYEAAASSYTKAIESAPDHLQTYPRLAGLLQHRLNRRAEADQWMTRLVQSNPDSANAHLWYGQYVYNLAQLRSADDARQHPIVLGAMIPGILSNTVKSAVEALKLADDDPDGGVLAAKGSVLVDAVRRALPILVSDLPLDDPMSLLLAAKGTGRFDDLLDPADLTDARDKALAALAAELPSEDRDALEVAQQHNVLTEALQNTAKALDDSSAMWEGATTGVLDYALEYALKADKLSSAEDNDATALWLATRCALEKETIDDARKYAKQGIEQNPKNVRLYLVMADVEVRAEQRDQAITALQQGLKETDDNHQLLWSLANLLIDAGKVDEAQQTLAKLAAAKYPETLLAYLGARIDYAQKRWRSAIDRLEEARSGLTAWPQMTKRADLLTATAYFQLGNFDRQEQAIRRILNVDPFHVAALRSLAEVELNRDNVEAATEIFRRLAGFKKVPANIWLPLHQLRFAEIARAPAGTRNWTALENALEQAAEKAPDSVSVVRLRTQVKIAQGHLREAVELMRSFRDANPDVPNGWTQLASLAMRQKEWDEAQRELDAGDQQLGYSVPLQVARAEYLMYRYAKESTEQLRTLSEKGEQHFQQKLAEPGLSEEDERALKEEQVALYKGLIEVAIRVGDHEHAIQLCEKLTKLVPQDVQVFFRYFDVVFRARKEGSSDEALKRMDTILDEIERVEGRGAYWHCARALRLLAVVEDARDKRLDDALNHMAQARRLRPSWDRLPRITAGILQTQGRYDEALEKFQEAFKMGDRDPRVMRQMFELLRQRRLWAEAEKILDQLTGPDAQIPPELRAGAVAVLSHRGDLDGAIELQRGAAAESTDYREHLWLGQLLIARARQREAKEENFEAETLNDEAEETLRHALSLSEETVDTWVALLRFLSAANRTTEAEQVLRQAESKISTEEFPLAMALCYEAMNQIGRARKQYEAVLSAQSDDPIVAREVANFYIRHEVTEPAEDLLRRIADGKIKGNDTDLVWARRRLASILGARGGQENFREAMKLIEANQAIAGDSEQDRRILARVCAFSSQTAQRQRAIKMFQELAEKGLASPDDRFLLARLYLGDGAWSKANEQFRRLVTDYPKQPRFMGAYIEALVGHGQYGDAEKFLDRLKEIAPHEYQTVDLDTRLLVRRQQYADAIDRLNAYAANDESLPADETTRLRLAAAAFEKLALTLTKDGRDDDARQFARQAELTIRKYVELRPQHELLLAAFLGRQGRCDEGLTILERSWEDADYALFSQTLTALLKSPGATEAQIERAERVLQAGLKKFDRNVRLLLVLAELRSQQDRHAESEAAYREILDGSRDHIVALNNLAFLLAVKGQKLKEATRLVNRAIEIAGPQGSFLDTRASVYIARKQFNKALADLEGAIEAADTPVRRFHQAQAYERLGKKKDAAESLAKAQKLGLEPRMLQPGERRDLARLKKKLKVRN